MKKLLLSFLLLFLVGCSTAQVTTELPLWGGNRFAAQYTIDEEYPDSIMEFIALMNPMGVTLTLKELEPEVLEELTKACLPEPPAGILVVNVVITICQYVILEERFRTSSDVQTMNTLGWKYQGKVGTQHIFVLSDKNMAGESPRILSPEEINQIAKALSELNQAYIRLVE